MWVGTERTDRDKALEEVMEYARGLAISNLSNPNEVTIENFIDENSGTALSKEMEARLNSPLPFITTIPPRYTPECFLRGNGKSQDQLHRFFHSTFDTHFERIENQDTFLDWLAQIKKELEKKGSLLIMGHLRQKWFKSDTEDIRKVVRLRGKIPNSNTDNTSAEQ